MNIMAEQKNNAYILNTVDKAAFEKNNSSEFINSIKENAELFTKNNLNQSFKKG